MWCLEAARSDSDGVQLSSRTASLAVLGGTFDPIHLGHLQMAIEARELLGVDRVKLVPSWDSYHRGRPSTDPEIRAMMLKAALAGVDGLEADFTEHERKGPSYTVDTLTHFRDCYGVTCPIILLLGEDAFAAIDTWKDWRRLTGLAHIAVVRRPGEGLDLEGLTRRFFDMELEQPEKLSESPFGHIVCIRTTPIGISATQIRTRVSKGLSIDFLVPERVNRLIKEKHLYLKEEVA